MTGNVPKKNDLTHFYVIQDEGAVDGVDQDFLYLAWARAEDDGTANIDFEFNQNYCLQPTDPGCSRNGVTPARLAGDMLILYDFPGGVVVEIGLSRWVTDPAQAANPAEPCQDTTNTPPCWGKVRDLDAAANAEGGVKGLIG